MSRKRKTVAVRAVLAGAGLLFLLVVVAAACVYFRRPAYVGADTTQWRTGDVFFSVGDAWESVAVRTLTGAKNLEFSDLTPSHCGIVVRTDGEVRLVHASTVAKRVVSETPEQYVSNNGTYCLYVAQAPCPVDTAALRLTLDSLLQAAVPFDFEFNHNDASALYCTELVVSALEQTGCRSFSNLRSNSYIYPADLLNQCSQQGRTARAMQFK